MFISASPLGKGKHFFSICQTINILIVEAPMMVAASWCCYRCGVIGRLYRFGAVVLFVYSRLCYVCACSVYLRLCFAQMVCVYH